MKFYTSAFVFLLLFVLPGARQVKAQQKLSLDELIAKHLDSIGTKAKRDAVKNQIAGGRSAFESKLPSKKTVGKAVIVSDANNLFYVTSFVSQEYPFEKIGFFADKVNLPFVTAGARSPLGAFISDHSKILSDGVFAGNLSINWALLNPKIDKAKFKYAGTRKVNDRKAYVIDYFVGGSTSFTVKMYFDAENFQHLRTEYRDFLTPKEATFGQLGEQGGVLLTMSESFGDYKSENGLTLPHSYKINYTTSSTSGSFEYNWGITVSQYLFNQNLAPDFFTFDEKK